MKKLDFKKTIPMSLLAISTLLGIGFSITKKPAKAVNAVSDNEAAWRIEASASWKSAPSKDVIDSYFLFSLDSQELSKITIGKSEVTCSFNSVNCPTSYKVFVKNNKFTAKTVKYSFKIKYRGEIVKEYSGDHYFATIGSDNFDKTINLSGEIPTYKVSIQNNNVKNYSNLCTSFNIPTSNTKLPYINNQTFKEGMFNTIPVSNNSEEIFLGYQGSVSKKYYYNEKLEPSDISYDNTDNGILIPVFEKPVTDYPLHLYYDVNLNIPYVDDNYNTYSVNSETILPVIPNTPFVTYNGWFEVINGVISQTAVYSIPKGCLKEKTFVANSSRVHYKVNLNTNGATSCESLTEYISGDNTTLPIPTKNGFTFGGWYSNSSFVGNAVTAITSNDYGDKTYYAKWSGNTYTVTLVIGEDVICDSLTSYVSGVGAVLPIPYLRGFSFAGWYTNSSFSGSSYSEISNTSYGNLTFYPKWNYSTVNDGSYRITCYGYLSTSGGKDSNVTVKFYNSSNVVYFESPNTTVNSKVRKDDKVLICDIFTTVLPYRVQFCWNNCLANTTHSVADVFYNGKKLDCSFDQNVYATFKNSINSPDDASTEKERKQAYLVDKSNSISFSFNNMFDDASFNVVEGSTGPDFANEEFLDSSGKTTEFCYEKPELIDDIGTKLELDGYYDIDGSTKYFDDDLKPTNATNYSNNLVLYPAFKQSLSFETDGGTLSYDMPTYLAGVKNKNLPIASKPGYAFKGWSIKKAQTRALKANSNEIISEISENNKNPLTLVAEYETVQYLISYDLDGGTFKTTYPTSYNIESSDIVLPAPTKKYYDFVGWSGTGIESSEPNPIVTIKSGSTGDRSYKAHYKPTKYNITYTNVENTSFDSGRFPSNYTILDGNITISNNIEKENCRFDGWTYLGKHYSANENVVISCDTGKDIELIANWVNLYNVRFINSVTGEEIFSKIYEDGTKIDRNSLINEINDWENDGFYYSFDNFYVDETCETVFDFDLPIKQDKTVYIGYNRITITEHHLDLFVQNYMHPEVSKDNYEDTGMCKGDNGYYSIAKNAFNLLSDEEREEFIKNSQYVDYYNRLSSWAIANNEHLDSSNKLIVNNKRYLTNIFNENSTNNFVLISFLCLSSISLIAFIFYKKRA